jgi:hypothetical protein
VPFQISIGGVDNMNNVINKVSSVITIPEFNTNLSVGQYRHPTNAKLE